MERGKTMEIRRTMERGETMERGTWVNLDSTERGSTIKIGMKTLQTAHRQVGHRYPLRSPRLQQR